MKRRRYRVTIFLAELWKGGKILGPFSFWDEFWEILHHELLHGLGYKLGIPGYRHRHRKDWVESAASALMEQLRILHGRHWVVLDSMALAESAAKNDCVVQT